MTLSYIVLATLAGGLLSVLIAASLTIGVLSRLVQSLVSLSAGVLLGTAVDVNHINRLGWTALLEAIILGDGGPAHTEIVRLLLAAGARHDIADAQGVTPLAHARQRGQGPIVGLLLAAERR